MSKKRNPHNLTVGQTLWVRTESSDDPREATVLAIRQRYGTVDYRGARLQFDLDLLQFLAYPAYLVFLTEEALVDDIEAEHLADTPHRMSWKCFKDLGVEKLRRINEIINEGAKS